MAAADEGEGDGMGRMERVMGGEGGGGGQVLEGSLTSSCSTRCISAFMRLCSSVAMASCSSGGASGPALLSS